MTGQIMTIVMVVSVPLFGYPVENHCQLVEKRYMQDNPQSTHEAWDYMTARWTSNTYRVRFHTVQSIAETDTSDFNAFQMSAWGISRQLREFLSDYTDGEIRTATEWLAIYQNQMVVDALEMMVQNAHMSGKRVPELENTFIAVEVELFLPRGLKIPVNCVTNIVPASDDDGMNKFVAVLDPAETRLYIDERTLPIQPPKKSRIH